MAINHVAVDLSCVQCSKSFVYKRYHGQRGANPKTCSEECKRNKKNEYYRVKYQSKPPEPKGICSVAGCSSECFHSGICTKHYSLFRTYGTFSPRFECKECGKSFEGRKRSFCSKSCRDLNALNREREAKGIPPRWEDGIPEAHKEFSCGLCGVIFRPKRAGRTKFCSQECGWQWQAVKLKARANGMRVKCTTFRSKCCDCGCQIGGLPKGTLRCDGCKLKLREKQCRDCGAEVAKGRQRCSQCRSIKLAESRKRSKTKARLNGKAAARRAARDKRIRSATVEAVNPVNVFRRDGWRCRICLRSTPKELRGSYEDRAPELDHVVPLSKGGDHSYANTQLLCRECNIRKSDKLRKQPRSFFGGNSQYSCLEV